MVFTWGIVAFLLNALDSALAIIKVSAHQHWWLAGGYDMEIERFRGY